MLFLMNITVAGTGYVGLSNAILLAQKNKVAAIDLVQSKVDLINGKKLPIVDMEIQEYLAQNGFDLMATTCQGAAYENPDFVIIAPPQTMTWKKTFLTRVPPSFFLTLAEQKCSDTTVDMNSTISVDYTDSIVAKFKVWRKAVNER